MSGLNENHTVVIFGGSGFIGSYVVARLAKTGAKILIVSRRPKAHEELKLCGAVGQINTVQMLEGSEEELTKIMHDATHVINLIGIMHESKSQTFQKVHVTLARKIARVAHKQKVKRLVHISALGADKALTSKYASTKYEGEKAVLNEENNATIIRPSVVFGDEDKFLGLFAYISRFSLALPLIGGGRTKFQPIHVSNLAEAIVKLLHSDKAGGKVFEVGGASVFTFKQILEMLMQATGRHRVFINVPFSIAKLASGIMKLLPKPILTSDQVELLKYDNVVSTINALDTLGIEPTPLAGYLEKHYGHKVHSAS